MGSVSTLRTERLRMVFHAPTDWSCIGCNPVMDRTMFASSVSKCEFLSLRSVWFHDQLCAVTLDSVLKCHWLVYGRCVFSDAALHKVRWQSTNLVDPASSHML